MHTPHETGVSRRVVLAGIAGNVMEWYDFAVYGYFAQAIGQHFFPSRDPTASVIAAFGVFAAGFLMRPIGGLLFGYIGDRIGRKAALTLSVLAMAVPTFLIGLLPGYAQIGVATSALMVGLRLVQGLSVGGEYTTSVVFLVEGAAPGQRGLMGSWSVFGSVAGILLGSAVGAVITSVLSAEDVQTWGWRVPFLAGLAVGWMGLYIRRHIPEAAARPGAERLGEPDGIIAFDPSSFPKRGTHSVGVKRQWCGHRGKVDNCQVGVFMGYVSHHDHALLDFRLSLPPEWTRDEPRRHACHVPPEVRYHTRQEQCVERLDAWCDQVPHGWVTGDDELGRHSRLRYELCERGERSVLGVPCTITMRDLEAPLPAYAGRGRSPKAPVANR